MKEPRELAPQDSVLPQWAPRVERSKIWRMYQNDAKGNRDEDLVDVVGWTLLMRVQSGLTVGEAQSGRVRCPRCETVIPVEWRRRRGKDITLHCANCGWQRPWPEYRKTFHSKHLGLGGMHAPCEEFARQYPQARTYQEKIILIDASFIASIGKRKASLALRALRSS